MVIPIKRFVFACALVLSCTCAAREIDITVKYGQESIVLRSVAPISISQILQRLEKLTVGHKNPADGKTLKFAAFPLEAMRFHNKDINGKNLWLCVGSKTWGEYEIEKGCTIQFMKSVKGLTVPKSQIWQFDEEAKDAS